MNQKNLIPYSVASLLLVYTFREFISNNFFRIMPIVILGLLFALPFIYRKDMFKLSKKEVLILFIILIGSLLLRISFPSTHSFYPDDHWIMEQSQHLVTDYNPYTCIGFPDLTEYCYYSKPIGHPTLLGIAIATFGMNNYLAIYFNTFLSLMVIVLAFILGKKQYGLKTAAFSAIIIGFSFRFLITSKHIDNVMSAIFFMTLTLIFYYDYYKNNKSNIPALISLFLMVLIRYEYGLLIVIPVWIYFSKLKQNRQEVIFSFIILFIIGYLSILHAQNLEVTDIILNSALSNNNTDFFQDLLLHSKGFFNIFGTIPTLIAIFVMLIFFNKINSFNKITSLGSIPLLAFYLIAISPHFKETANIFLIIFIPAITYLITNEILKQKYGTWIITIGVLVIISLGVSQAHIQKISIQNDELYILDAQSISWLQSKQLNNCTIITERPPLVTAFNEFSGIRTSDIYNKPNDVFRLLIEDKCVLFLENRFCYQNRDQGPAINPDFDFLDSTGRCRTIKENFKYHEIDTLKYQNIEYRLINITGIR